MLGVKASGAAVARGQMFEMLIILVWSWFLKTKGLLRQGNRQALSKTIAQLRLGADGPFP